MPRTALARAASRKTRELPRTTVASIVVVSRCVNPAERLASEVARSGHLDQLAARRAQCQRHPLRSDHGNLSFLSDCSSHVHGRHPIGTVLVTDPPESLHAGIGNLAATLSDSMSLASAPPPRVTARARVRPRGIAVRASSSSSSTDGADLSRRDLLSSGASVAPHVRRATPSGKRGVHLATRVVPPSPRR